MLLCLSQSTKLMDKRNYFVNASALSPKLFVCLRQYLLLTRCVIYDSRVNTFLTHIAIGMFVHQIFGMFIRYVLCITNQPARKDEP